MDNSERASHVRNLQIRGNKFGKWLAQLCLLGLYPDVKSFVGDTITLHELKGGNHPELENLSVADDGTRLYEMGVPENLGGRHLNSIDVEEFAAIGRNYEEHLDAEFISMVEQQIETKETLMRRIQAMDVLWNQLRSNVSYTTKHYPLDTIRGDVVDVPMFRMDIRAMDVKKSGDTETTPYLIVVCDEALVNVTEAVRVRRYSATEPGHSEGTGMPDIVEHTPTSTYLIYMTEGEQRAEQFLNNEVAREHLEDKAKHENQNTEHLFEASDKPNNIEQPEAPDIPNPEPLGDDGDEQPDPQGYEGKQSGNTNLGEHNLTRKGNG